MILKYLKVSLFSINEVYLWHKNENFDSIINNLETNLINELRITVGDIE